MNIKQLNEVFSDLDNIGHNLIVMSEDESDDYHEEKSQGSEGLKVSIYKIPDTDIFLKVKRVTDSYGDGEKVSSIQFVAAQEKTILTYE